MSNLKRISTLTALLGLTVSSASAGDAQLSAQSIIVNPSQPELNVQVWTNRDASGTGNPVYQIGERISVGLKTNADAYIYLFNVNADGNIDLFFPNRYEDSNYVQAGTRVFPRNGANYGLSVGGPNGQDKLLAVASTTELSLNDIATFEGQQQFATVSVQGQDGLAQALSVVVNPLPSNAWVTDTAFFRVGNTVQTPQPQPTPAVQIQPGQRQDGSFDSAMVDAYARLKGDESLGQATTYAAAWGNGFWQKFNGVGAYGDAALLHANGSSRSYSVHGRLLARYLSLAQAENGTTRPPSRLGWAAGDEKVIPQNLYGTTGLYGFFQNGALYDSQKYGTFWLTGPVLKSYQGLGGSGSFLGFPTRDQYMLNGAWAADFEGGSIRTVNGVSRIYRK
ncbi:DUF4384 domain-containing protein [Deinococcus sp. AJ005]|uniref:DUF4384 domain-containing protein n=1 Tax=Deinococcus sp. AJ005 TaxID=2652443 RepID=UPI00125CC70A|nr:DUF4384 domain-containing protein [Deinococcus sp. AJ005]QFP77435.1 DUF4384 domain-containing protein [Deinococcus sp. AJ005]